MRNTLLLLILNTCWLFTYAQYTFVKQWDRRYGGTGSDGFTCIIETLDGGYLIGGYSSSNVGGNKTQPCQGGDDFWIVKVDTNGNIQWDRRYGGLNPDPLFSIIQLKDSSFILGGRTYSGAGGDKTEPSRGGMDYWVVKVDAQGSKLWDKRYGGSMNDWFGSIVLANDGGFIVGGSSGSPISGDKTHECWDLSHFDDDGWLVKIDSAGNKEWDKVYGGLQYDAIVAMLPSKDNGFLLAAYSGSDSSGNKSQNNRGFGDYWLIKTDSTGSIQSDKVFGGSEGDYVASIVNTGDGGYLLGGMSYSDSSGDKTQNNWGVFGDYWIVKVDSNGNKLWDKSYGGTQADELSLITVTSDGGFLLSGDSESGISGDKSENNLGTYQVWLVKVDSVGNKQWDKTILTNGFDGGSAIQTSDGCYIAGVSTKAGIGGYKTQANWDGTNQTSDYWLLKFCMEDWNGMDDRPQTTDHSGIQMQVYPNPFTGDLSIALIDDLREAAYTITDVNGKIIYHREEANLAKGYTKVLDLSGLASGVYFVNVESGGQFVSKCVVKE